MSGLIGKKIGMTSLFDDEGKNLACTVIQAGPCIVTQVKNQEKDVYNAVQLGFFDIPIFRHFSTQVLTILAQIWLKKSKRGPKKCRKIGIYKNPNF